MAYNSLKSYWIWRRKKEAEEKAWRELGVDENVLLCQEKSQNKQTKSYQPTRGSEERAEFLYKFSKSTGERKSQ